MDEHEARSVLCDAMMMSAKAARMRRDATEMLRKVANAQDWARKAPGMRNLDAALCSTYDELGAHFGAFLEPFK